MLELSDNCQRGFVGCGMMSSTMHVMQCVCVGEGGSRAQVLLVFEQEKHRGMVLIRLCLVVCML